MKILHVIPYVSPIFGGPPQVVKTMAQASIAKGHEVIIISTTAGLSNMFKSETSISAFEAKGYRLFPISHLSSWFYSKLLAKELRKLVGVIDIVHLHIPFTAPFFFASRWAIKNNIPYVITTHGLLDEWSMNQKKIKKWTYYFLIERHILKKAAKIHVTSTFEKKAVERLGLGVPLEIFPIAVTLEKIDIEISEEVISMSDLKMPHILFIGRLHPVKGIHYLIRSLEILNQRGFSVLLDIAGSGDNFYVEFLKRKIQESSLADLVKFHDYADERQKQILYKRASAFVLPSLHENFGLAVVEAMLAGLPVIVTDQVGLALKVIEFGAGIVVPARDVESLADAIQKILTNNQVLVTSDVKNLIISEYSFMNFSDRLNDFYRA